MTPYMKYRLKWKDCQQCDLCNQRSRIVLARGKVPAEVLFIGEAPGASEDALGKPFIGPAGKLLDHIINVSLDGKYDYALTNLVACYPREAKEAGTNEPPSWAIEKCAVRLQEFVRLCKPGLIVLVGKLAAKHATVQPSSYLQLAEITHPAAMLRMDPAQKGLAIQRAIVVIEDAVEEI